nr:MAG TPA: hypothetical protein [Caudoviricetes sp.]DAK88545.1 MAG TPA: hypothetical protein [Caudoviricetes sp.]
MHGMWNRTHISNVRFLILALAEIICNFTSRTLNEKHFFPATLSPIFASSSIMNETTKHKNTMQIKTNDGNYDVASKGLGNTALGLGIAGLATSLLGGSASLLGIGRNNGMTANPTDPDARFVTKSETNLIQENSTLKTELAIQKSENYTDKKLVEVTQYLDTKLRRVEDKVDANKDAQQAVNAQQMAYNAAANASIDVLKSQVASLSSVTKLFIPSTNVCQTGCGCGCNQ